MASTGVYGADIPDESAQYDHLKPVLSDITVEIVVFNCSSLYT